MSSTPVRFTFVRHGQSTANVAGRWQGHGDAPLSELGRAQAEAVAARLRRVAFDHLVSSDLSRAHHTALALGRAVEVDPRLREIDVGAWEGRSRAEVAELFPSEVLALRGGAEHVKVGGGESWEEAHARFSRAIDELSGRLNGAREVGVFSHGGVLSSLFWGLFDVRGRHPRPLGHLVNTSVTVARVMDEAVELERYNDASHHPSTARFSPERFGRESAVLAAMAVGRGELRPEPSLVAGVSAVFAAPSDEARARGLAASLEAKVVIVREPIDRLLEGVAPGKRALALAPPGAIGEAATRALRPGPGSRVSLRDPAEGSVTHLVKAPGGTLLGDYSVGGGS